MTKIKILIISSDEGIKVAQALEIQLHLIAEITILNNSSLNSKNFLLKSLVETKKEFDFCILVLTEDDCVSKKSGSLEIHGNLMFGLGLSVGSIGYERTIIVHEQSVNIEDQGEFCLSSTIFVYDSKRTDSNLRAAVNPCCTQIKELVDKLGESCLPKEESNKTEQSINNVNSEKLNKIGLIDVIDYYTDAEKQIIADLNETSGPIRLFLQIGTQNIAEKGTIFDTIQKLATEKSIEIKILHASKDSPLFDKDRLVSLGKNPEPIYSTLEYVNNSLSRLQRMSGTSLRHRKHDFPFIWRIYATEKRLYLMPYFSIKDAIRYSPVLIFEKKDNSLYNTFTDWFDYMWTTFAPKKVRISDLITPATPAGTALFLEWNGYHVFSIPKRDLTHSSQYIRFYGVGGKRKNSEESLIDCAKREASEEIGDVISNIINAEHTYLLKANGTIEVINLVDHEVRPRLILEKREHSGYGSMTRLDDNYYLVAFNASLSSKPIPSSEIAALIYIKDLHLSLIRKRMDLTIAELIKMGVEIECQPGISLSSSAILIPHGTAHFLIRQLPE